MSHDFRPDYEKGKYGEYLIQKYLTSHFEEQFTTLEDKSGVSAYQKADIDLLINLDGRRVQGIEVKNDNTLHPNLFFETVSVVRKHGRSSPGCMIISEADALYYVYEALDIAVVCSLSRLRDWVLYYKETGALRKEVPVYNKEYEARGIPLPVKRLLGEDARYKGMGAIKLIDLNTNERLSYEEFERRRKDMLVQTEGEMNVEIEKDRAWQSRMERLAPNKDKLDIPLRSDTERRFFANTYIKKIRA